MLQSTQDLHRKVQGLSPLQLALLLNIALQCDAVDKLHDDILDSVAEADIVHLYDIGMGQDRDRLGLITETAEELAVVRKLFLQDLDSDPTVFDLIVSTVYIGHAAYTEKIVYFIASVKTLADKLIHLYISSFLPAQRLSMIATEILSLPPLSLA